jgi:cation transport ATPase
VPWILTTAAAVFCLRWLGSADLAHSLMYAAAVLLVACPCSLGLATPAAIMVGSGRAAELGILFKGGEVFEAARRIDAVLIDKTGTLTEGRMSLATVVPVAATSEYEVLALAAAVEAGSEHPLARAVLAAAEARAVTVPVATDHRAEPGAGIAARVGSSSVRAGRPEGLPAELEAQADRLAADGLMVVAVWRDDEVVGLLGASDRVKEGAAEVVERIRKWGRTIAVVSGDRRPAVEAAARQAGIDTAARSAGNDTAARSAGNDTAARSAGNDIVVSQVFPDGKVEEVRRLQAEGKRVAFVGDGVNDAPALAQADLGIALGTGTDIAIEAADVLIMGGDLGLVADCLELAGRTYWVIVQNLVWAFAYNSLMVPLAVVGRVSPLMAAASMAGSSWTVVSNALRLQRFHRSVTQAGEPEPAEDDEPAWPAKLASAPAPPPPAVVGATFRQRTVVTLGRLWARPWES